jgi:acetolactate synthase-1/2/3 large subunit
MTGGEAVVEQLEREDVDIVFGIPGVHTLEIYDALLDSDIDHVTTRHEQGAGFMADGYARATGRIGILLAITGPGLTNAATPIAQAYSDSSPLLVISSDNPTVERDRGRGLLHELKDQEGVMESMTAYSETVERVDDIPQAIAEAFGYLRSHRPRAVHVQIPKDVLERVDAVSTLGSRTNVSPPPIDEQRLDEVTNRLASSKRPLLIVGGGAIDAATDLRQLINRTRMPVVSTVAGKGVIPEDHDCSLGARIGTEAVDEFIQDRDLALAVGTELSPRDLHGVDLPDELIHVDIDYGTIDRNYPADLAIVGDASSAVNGLVNRLDSKGSETSDDDQEAMQEVQSRISQLSGESNDDQEVILAALRKSIDEDTIVVNDMTKLTYGAQRLFPVSEPGTFLYPRGYGTLGFSPPAAFGAALGGDRQVVALVGDGGFMFTFQELATAVKYDVSVPVIVCNDDSYGIISDKQNEVYGRTIGADLHNPDFLELASAFGAAGTRVSVENIDAKLPTILDDAFERDRPTIVEIPVDL